MMKNTRKIITILLVLTLALSTCLLSACNLPGSGTETPSGNGGENKDKLYSLTFVGSSDDVLLLRHIRWSHERRICIYNSFRYLFFWIVA